jgi:F0F1-type ATP synthase delta subunit
MDESTQSTIFQSLQKRDGGTITREFKVDASLIGGARIRLGSDVWDATVRTHLYALDANLS